MSCELCGEPDGTPTLLATIDDIVVGYVCDRHGVGADPHADATAIINRLLMTVGKRYPDEAVQVRDANDRTVLGRTRP